MIPMKIKGENDQWMGRTDEAHSLSRVVTETGNFGLADAYREKYPELSLQPGESPTEEPVKIKQEQHSWAWSVAGRGRGRGRPPMEWDMSGEQRAAVTPLFPWEMDFKSETDRSTLDHAASLDEAKGPPEQEKKVFGLHEDAPMPTGPLPKPRLDTRPEITGIYFSPRDDHLKTMFHAFDKKEESASAGSSKAKPKGKNKTNGFILFIKDRARKDGVNGSLNELMDKYNADWQGLPTEVKDVWKAKAKGKPPAKAPTEHEGLRMNPRTAKEPVSRTLKVKVEPGFNPDKPILPQTRSNSSTSTSKSPHGYEEGGEAKKIKQEVEDDWY